MVSGTKLATIYNTDHGLWRTGQHRTRPASLEVDLGLLMDMLIDAAPHFGASEWEELICGSTPHA